MQNNDIDKKIISRKKRGEISKEDLANYKNLSTLELINLLKDKEPQKRTIAATLLKNQNSDDNKLAIESLSHQFKKEKALYTRLAISNSLTTYTEEAIPYLIDLLGKIGNNQERALPKKYFNKKSFPLPRDLAARTLAKMGDLPTHYLIDVIDDNFDVYTDFVKEQALDVIGAIAYKNNDYGAFESINNFYTKTIISENISEESRKILLWKIVRSLSGFKNNENALKIVIDILKKSKEVDEIQWESLRTIGFIKIANDEVLAILNSFKDNENPNIIMALKNAKNSLEIE